jgi:hypothetical protein
LVLICFCDLSLHIANAQKPDAKKGILEPDTKRRIVDPPEKVSAKSWTFERINLTGDAVVDMLRNKEVQKELNLDGAQQVDIARMIREIESALAEWRDELALPSESKRREIAERLTKLTKSFVAEIDDLLDPNQVDRLLGIICQIHGVIAVVHPIIEKRLEISVKQRAKIHGIIKGFKPGKDDIRETILNVLTDDQKQKLDSMKGKPIELETNPLTGVRHTRVAGSGEHKASTNTSTAKEP